MSEGNEQMRKRHVMLAAVMGLVLAACAGDGGDATTTTVVDTPTTTAEMTPSTEMMDEMSIIETAEATDGFSTLVAAVEAAGLRETLDGEGPFTVFAPTDDAFAALPEGTVEGLLEDPDALSNILLYHVVPGEVTAEQVTTLESATTAQGADVAISLEGDSVFVDDAQVIMTDIATSNGVIHVIDAVLMPPEA
jgi:uncharacterized surface protein with fasciclin (FAS1) repeats